MFDERSCHTFGGCIKAGEGYIARSNRVLHIDREQIPGFSRLRDICQSKTLRICGSIMSVEEILSEVLKDVPFYSMSGGGITVSGGEPFARDHTLSIMLSEIKSAGIHISAKTSLHIP
ncbi:MAG TPA: radical SAM protein [Bacteroidales bacterium]|nr:radical SAM protein [Bacteroidales bacterium]